jgi:hypothetical protein
MVRFGIRHRRIWAVLPFVLLAFGVVAFAQLADHYAWGGGTTLLTGVLMLCLFTMIVGPFAVLPSVLQKMGTGAPSSRLLDDLQTAARELQTGSVSTGSVRREP